jgi:hypothetical protein
MLKTRDLGFLVVWRIEDDLLESRCNRWYQIEWQDTDSSLVIYLPSSRSVFATRRQAFEGLIVDEKIAAHQRLEGRVLSDRENRNPITNAHFINGHDEFVKPFIAKMVAHPVNLLLCAVSRLHDRRSAQEDL